MQIIAKQVENQTEISQSFELFTTETIKDVNNKDVIIPRSLGHFSLASLEAEKNQYNTMIASVDEKIAAINSL